MNDTKYTNDTVIANLPILPLRDTVVFVNNSASLYVARSKSVEALEYATRHDTGIGLFTQRSADTEDPGDQDLYEYGVSANILQMLHLSEGTIKIMVEGVARIRRGSIQDRTYLAADVTVANPTPSVVKDFESTKRDLISRYEFLCTTSKGGANSEILTALAATKEPKALIELLASQLNFSVEQKQKILESDGDGDDLEMIRKQMDVRIELRKTDNRIQGRVKSQMERGQKEYYLNEQMKAIRKELGELSGNDPDSEELSERVAKAKLSKEAREKAETELSKLEKMAPMAAEATVIQTYIDTLLSVPWGKRSKISSDLDHAAEVLDRNHYGLAEVKDRILEYLAVYKRKEKLSGPMLCLVGAPGVGKSALGRSIAEAVDRKFARISLGGMRDEAEIRGHRRTYIGSMPGKIIQNLIKVKAKNPVLLLDEIDKLSSDFRGDPSSALLEVLDPEQNQEFADHYLEVGFDLSEIMFVATANTLQIPAPLRDRMEKIHIPGYIEDEKLEIALRHLIPKQKENHGLANRELTFSNEVVTQIIRGYTREAGVRELDRLIAKICRKTVRYLYQRDASRIKLSARKNSKSLRIKHDDIVELLGLPKYKFQEKSEDKHIGQVLGMAWTEGGGDLLNIEASMVPGKGKVTYTGSLGKVMQESIEAAMVLVRSRATDYQIPNKIFQEQDFHVHVPEGATPKDGPSAGGAISLALLSCVLKAPVSNNLALTGEITLRGKVLAIGGLREKLAASVRGGIQRVIIPEENSNELRDIPDNIKDRLEICTVRSVGEIFNMALETDKKKPKFFSESWLNQDLPRKSSGSSKTVINH